VWSVPRSGRARGANVSLANKIGRTFCVYCGRKVIGVGPNGRVHKCPHGNPCTRGSGTTHPRISPCARCDRGEKASPPKKSKPWPVRFKSADEVKEAIRACWRDLGRTLPAKHPLYLRQCELIKRHPEFRTEAREKYGHGRSNPETDHPQHHRRGEPGQAISAIQGDERSRAAWRSYVRRPASPMRPG
jgi:hypothetical protein